MLIIISAVAAVIPMIIYLYLIWRFDSYDREPVILVLRNYLWGAVGAVIFSILGSDIVSIIFSIFISDASLLENIHILVTAPVIEELTKGSFLLFTLMHRKFDNLTDGIVYGGAIGLGFGMTENFLYFLTYGDTIANLIMLIAIRTLFSAVMHGVSTATLGAFLGYAKFRDLTVKIVLTIVGFWTAIFIHFMWNVSVSFDTTALLGFIFLVLTVVVMIVVFNLSIHGERKIIFNELNDEAANGIIPADHLHILNSPKRNHNGWIDENIRKSYVNSATILAFRKMQYRNSKGSQKFLYGKEIEYYRNYIRIILSNPGGNL